MDFRFRVNFYNILFSLIVLTALFFSFQLASMPADILHHSVIIDDTLYYTIVANNVVAGHGFTFDKINPTNGFQPLWQLICIFLAFLLRDTDVQLRTLVFLSGLMWITSGINIFLVFKRILNTKWIAVFVLSGLILSPNLLRIFAQAMESAVLAILSTSFIYWLLRVNFFEKIAERNSKHLIIAGLFLTMIALARVEAFVFSLIFILFYILKSTKEIPFVEIGKRTALILAPIAILAGGYFLFNIIIFDNIIPVSGSVKRFYESEWLKNGYPNGGFWSNLLFHFKHIFQIAFHNLSSGIELFLWRNFSLPVRSVVFTVTILITLTAGIFGTIAGSFSKTQRISPVKYTFFIFILFALVHFLMFALLLPHFTPYGLWYFPNQYIGLWIIFGIALIGIKDSIGRLSKLNIQSGMDTMGLVGVLALIMASSWSFLEHDFREGYRTNRFKKAAKWLDRNVGFKGNVGAFSSGFLSYFSRYHTVINLDGVMNSEQYLNNYLKKHRVSDFIKDTKIKYISDYFSFDALKGGIHFGGAGLGLDRLKLLKWWPLDKETAYVIFELEDKVNDIEDNSPEPHDQFSRYEFAAKVLGRYAVVNDRDLLKQDLAKKTILSTYRNVDDGEVWHVLVDKGTKKRINIPLGQIDVERRFNIRFENGITLLGVNIEKEFARPGDRVALTRFWLVEGKQLRNENVEIHTYVNAKKPGWLWHLTKGVYDTYPLDDWSVGEVIKETYVLDVPKDIPFGPYPITIGLWDVKALRWISNDGPQVKGREEMVFIGNIMIGK